MTARQARDEALDTVSDNSGEWMGWAENAVSELPPGWEGTGEDIRLELTRGGLPAPHHHNAWGALIHTCLRHKLLFWTGHIGQMRVPSSHARSTKVYRI